MFLWTVGIWPQSDHFSLSILEHCRTRSYSCWMFAFPLLSSKVSFISSKCRLSFSLTLNVNNFRHPFTTLALQFHFTLKQIIFHKTKNKIHTQNRTLSNISLSRNLEGHFWFKGIKSLFKKKWQRENSFFMQERGLRVRSVWSEWDSRWICCRAHMWAEDLEVLWSTAYIRSPHSGCPGGTLPFQGQGTPPSWIPA